jgi:hypothetical protein
MYIYSPKFDTFNIYELYLLYYNAYVPEIAAEPVEVFLYYIIL